MYVALSGGHSLSIAKHSINDEKSTPKRENKSDYDVLG